MQKGLSSARNWDWSGRESDDRKAVVEGKRQPRAVGKVDLQVGRC